MNTILLVDDSRVSREVIKVFLVGRQARVLEACDGKEALALLRHQTPDLILADLEMPELDGVGLCEALHADARLRRIPVLVLSGTATVEQKRRCRNAGALEVLAKPIQPQALLAAVDRHLAPSPAHTPAPHPLAALHP
jgi:two-component system chemotaxis response regulator CheY